MTTTIFVALIHENGQLHTWSYLLRKVTNEAKLLMMKDFLARCFDEDGLGIEHPEFKTYERLHLWMEENYKDKWAMRIGPGQTSI